MKILILTNQLLITCGVSKHLLYFLQEVQKYPEYEINILCGGGDAVDVYKDLCKELIVNPAFKHENRSVINFIKAFFFLLKLLVKNKYQIIHTHTHYADNIAKLSSYFTKVNTLQTVHGITEPIGILNHYPSKYFIAVNEHVYDYLTRQKNKPPKNVKLVRSGIPLPKNSKKSVDQKLKVIAAGRLIPEKGFNIFIESISKLKNDTLDKAEFLIAGKGGYELELKKLTIKLHTNINFIGEVEDLISQFIKTNIFVIPSRSANEGFPLTIIESALTNNLVISSNFLGYDSVLKDKINSLIFNVNDSDDLADKLEYAIENFNEMNKIIERSFIEFCNEFSLDKMVNETILFYKEILG